MSKLSPLKCDKCGAQILTKHRDLILVCSNCSNIMEFEKGKLVGTRSRIAKFSLEREGTRTFVPFWVVETDITIQHEETIGGGLTRMFKGQTNMIGKWNIFVCAADFPPAAAKRWNQTLTYNPPSFAEETNFGGITPLPVKFNHLDAYQDAEFLFLAHEMEKAGTLQRISYDFKIQRHEILYMPFYYHDGTYHSGLTGVG